MKKVIVELLMILFLSSSVIGQTFNSRSFSIKNEKDNALLINGKGENVINSTNPIDLYNGACSSALKGDTNTAFKLLNKSADYGYRDLEHINQDLDLCILRKSDSWRQVINRINENNENYVTSDKLSGLIIESIKSNNVEILWNFGNEHFKKTHDKDTIKNILDEFSKLREKLQFGFDDSQNSQSMATAIQYTSNQKISETKKYNYYFMPKIIGETTNKYFRTDVGYGVYLELSSKEDKWELNEMEMRSNYFDSKLDVKELIRDYFIKANAINCQISISTSNKAIVSLTSYRADSINFVKTIKTLEWQELSALTKTKEIVVYKILFLKNDEIPSNNFGDAYNVFFNKNMQSVNLEIVFLGGQNNIILSNGEKYGIYKTNVGEMQKWINSEILKLK